MDSACQAIPSGLQSPDIGSDLVVAIWFWGEVVLGLEVPEIIHKKMSLSLWTTVKLCLGCSIPVSAIGGRFALQRRCNLNLLDIDGGGIY